MLKGNYIGGYILYGYDVVNKKYVVNETESKIVKQIFEDYANGKKTTEIVEDLNNKGLKTKQGLKFSINIISKMLRNPKYIGKCVMDDVEYTNIFPVIIDEKTFKRCNLIMDEHKHRQRKDINSEDVYILSGKLYCGVCGSLMTVETGTSKTGAIHRYYKCFGKKRKTTDCEKHNVRKDDIEDFVFETTKEYVLQPEVIEKISQVVVDKFNSELADNVVLNKLNSELKEKDKSINSMLDAIEKGIITKSTQDRLLKLENEKALLEDKIAYEQAHSLKPLEKDKINQFLSIYARKNFDSKTDRNDFFNGFISKVTLYDNGVVIEYNAGVDKDLKEYDRPDDNGTTIFKKGIDISNYKNKKLPFEFKRQLSGGVNAIQS